MSGACPVATCGKSFASERALYLHTQNDHTYEERGETPPLPARRRGRTAKATTGTTPSVAKPKESGYQRGLTAPKFSKVSDNGACPKCGSTSLKSKRSGTGKLIGAVFGGVGIALAPKSQVRCEGCGEIFRRG